MAERPIFIPSPESAALVKERFFALKWNPGFAAIQKEKNIKALHAAAGAAGHTPLLEVSSKSPSRRGRHMSAFHMTVPIRHHGPIKLELAFQGSKVFERGGPFTDLFTNSEEEIGKAKRDPRLKESGALVGFRFEGVDFPTEPKTVFYDWLYCSFLVGYRRWAPKLYAYAGFTDIEFNPRRSINCQARSAALFVSLMKRGELDVALRSPEHFIRRLSDSQYRPSLQGDRRFTSESLFGHA